MSLDRYLTMQIRADLSRKMVFLGGPRQVGKTTLSKRIRPSASRLWNWDISADREAILRGRFTSEPLWIFDEIHKYRKWRNFIKGLYDGRRPGQQILVTGSARLDLYRFGGDSLQGRYHYLRLHPLSVAELGINTAKDFQSLLRLGGFPEPYFGGSDVQAKRWSREYRTRLLRDDITALESTRDLGSLELLMLRLPELVGSPLSINGLREDLRLNHATVAKWLDILERTYAIFRLNPFGGARIRAVKKERKHYHFDWTLLKEKGKRFENLVACHLLKWVNFVEDTQGESIELRYFRDVERREIDFVVERDGEPTHFVECKWDDDDISPALRYMQKKFSRAAFWQISAVGSRDYLTAEGIRVAPAVRFLAELV